MAIVPQPAALCARVPRRYNRADVGAWAAILWTVLHAVQLGAGRARDRPAPLGEARAALEAGDFERARARAVDAALLRPRDASGWLVVGLALFRDGRAAEAVAPFRRVVELDPSSSLGWFNLGSSLYQSSQFDAAASAWHRAAALDGKLAPLALYDASQAARDAGHTALAERDLVEATREARAHGQLKLLKKLEGERGDLAGEEERALAKKGKAAIQAGRVGEAIPDYRAALAHARARNAPVEDQCELAYGLGHALLRDHDAAGAAAVFGEAARLQPRDSDFQLMLGLAEFQALHDDAAGDALRSALSLGLSDVDARTAHAYLDAIARDRRHDRLAVDIKLSGGWDSNVPQSSPVLAAGSATLPQTDAGFLAVDADLRWRFFRKRRDGFALDYHFGQLAYLASALDVYSVQEHELALLGDWSPHPRLGFELAAAGFATFSGVQTFTPFQAGITPSLRVFVREGHDLETQARYTHVWKDSLDVTYNYLAGHRDEAALGEEWRPRRWHLRLWAGYQFTSERIGVECVPLHQILFPLIPQFPAGGAQRYIIPYSYQGHEARLYAQGDPHRDVRITLDLRYEKLFYAGQSYLRDTQTLMNFYVRTRADDRWTVAALVRWYLPRGFDVAAEYSLVINRSDIDFRNPSTALDYDDKNYLKHVVALDAAWRY